MKQSLRLLIPFSLLVLWLITACEVPRSDGGAGDVPGITTPVVAATTPVGEPATPLPPPPDTTPATVAPPVGDALETGPSASVAPDASEVVPGRVLVKLTEIAAIEAFDAEAGTDNIVAAGVPSLDLRLREIGATSMDPVITSVAEATPGQDLARVMAQSGEVSQLYTVNFPPRTSA